MWANRSFIAAETGPGLPGASPLTRNSHASQPFQRTRPCDPCHWQDDQLSGRYEHTSEFLAAFADQKCIQQGRWHTTELNIALPQKECSARSHEIDGKLVPFISEAAGLPGAPSGEIRPARMSEVFSRSGIAANVRGRNQFQARARSGRGALICTQSCQRPRETTAATKSYVQANWW